ADHVDAEHLFAAGVDDHLHEAVGVGVGDGAPERREGELPDLDGTPALARLLRGDAGGRDLGVAEDDRRDAADVHLRLVTGDHLGHHLRLVRRLVGQHRLPRDVADGVDAGDVGAELAIDGDEAALDLDADLLEAEPFGVRAAPDRDQHLVGLDRLWRPTFAADLDGDGGAPPLLGPRFGLGAGHHLDPQLLELARDELDDLRVVPRQDVRQRLDDRHLGAELGVERPDLDPDVPAADDHEALGDRGEIERAGRVDDPLPVELEPRDLDRPRPGGDDDV